MCRLYEVGKLVCFQVATEIPSRLEFSSVPSVPLVTPSGQHPAHPIKSIVVSSCLEERVFAMKSSFSELAC